MASLKLSVFPDNNYFDSKKIIFAINSSRFASNTLFPGYICTDGALIVKPFCKLKHIRVSSLENESSDKLDGYQVFNPKNYVADEDNLMAESQVSHGDFDKVRVNIWRKFRGPEIVRLTTKMSLNVPKNIKKPEKYTVQLQKNSTVPVLYGQSVVNDLDFDDVGPDLSSELGNLILERLEKSNDDKALRFFEWMKVNGKLKKKSTAYNLILRFLGTKLDWDKAEVLIKEMISVSGREHNYQIFNTLIDSCYKSGLVNSGSRWFRMMLDYKVQPNVATFRMLMSLYQKGWVLEEAEYTFSHMRSLKITCQSAYSAMITIYTRMGLYDRAEYVIRFLREDGVVLNRKNWLVMLNTYCQQGKFSDSEQILYAMKEAGFSPCIIAYNTMITGYGRVSRMDQAEKNFCKIEELGFVPDETTYRSLIEGWGRVGNYEQARFYYMELKRLGFKPNSSNLYTLIRLQAKNEDEEGAKTTVADMMRIGCQKSSILGIVLQAYEKANRLEKMHLVLEGPLYDHVLKNQTSFMTVLTTYVKNCLIDSALQALSEKQWEDLIFEDNMYHLLICSCKNLGHLQNAVKIFSCMPKSAKPNLNIFCTMIDIYSKMSMFSEAEKLYTELKGSGVKLDMIAFRVVIRMYIKSGSLKEACMLLEIMDKENNIVPDAYFLRDILRIYQKRGMDNKLTDLYYKVLKNGEIWDEEMYNSVINCCARALPVDELSRLFDEMLNRGFTPNTVTFNVMLNAYGKSGLFEEAIRVFGMAKKRGLIDVISYNTIIAAYGKNKYLLNMLAAVRNMQFDGFSVSLEAYNCMLNAYGKEGEMDKFKSVLQRMKFYNCSFDQYTYNILMNIYGEQGWIGEVGAVLMELKECGIAPDLCSYNTLIKAYGIAGMVECALNLVKEMRENGIEPDLCSYNTLIKAYGIAGMVECALNLVKEMRENGIEPERITYTNLINALRKNDMFLEAAKWSLWMKQTGL